MVCREFGCFWRVFLLGPTSTMIRQTHPRAQVRMGRRHCWLIHAVDRIEATAVLPDLVINYKTVVKKSKLPIFDVCRDGCERWKPNCSIFPFFCTLKTSQGAMSAGYLSASMQQDL